MFTALLSLTALEAGASDCGIAPFFVSRTFGDTRGWLDHPGLISLQTAEVAPDVFWDDQPPPPAPTGVQTWGGGRRLSEWNLGKSLQDEGQCRLVAILQRERERER